jgi:hypothetical protein
MPRPTPRSLALLGLAALGCVPTEELATRDPDGDPALDVAALPSACPAVAAAVVTATGAQSGNPATNAIDGSLSTRWSNLGPSSITFDLGATKRICGVDLAWYKGAARVNAFRVSTSASATTGFTQVFSGQSAGKTSAFETYLPTPSDARYVRVEITGTTGSDWTSLLEARIGGTTPPSPAPGGTDGTLRWTGDFEVPGDFASGGTYPQFSANIDSCEHDETCATDSLAIVTSPVRGGSRAVRMRLRDGDVQGTSGTRVELQTKDRYTTALRQDYWYGWSIFLPADWALDPDDTKVVHQWHTASGQPGGNPIVGLRIKGSSWTITTEKDAEGDATTVATTPARRGVWTDFVMHLRWSPGSDGLVEVWKDGVKWYAAAGANMAAGTTLPPYQKFGMYGSFTGAVSERVLYYDSLKVATGPSAYALVAP